MRFICIISAAAAVLSAVFLVRDVREIWIPVIILIGGIIGLSLLYWAILGVFSLFYSLKKEYEKPSHLAFIMLNAAYYFVCTAARIRLHVSGLEKVPNDQRFLFVSNHFSRFDPMTESLALIDTPMAFISKPANFKIPIGRRFMKGTCYISINRDSAREASKSIARASELIKQNDISIAVFPEGHRGNGKELQDFKAGSLKAAYKADSPIVVAAICGTEKIHKNFPWRGTDVYLNIIEVIKPTKEKTVDLAEHIKTLVEQELEKIRKTENVL